MNLEQLLSTKGLVQQTPTPNEIRERAKQVAPQPIKLFYGETYDDKGNTIDSMKKLYYTIIIDNYFRIASILIKEKYCKLICNMMNRK